VQRNHVPTVSWRFVFELQSNDPNVLFDEPEVGGRTTVSSATAHQIRRRRRRIVDKEKINIYIWNLFKKVARTTTVQGRTVELQKNKKMKRMRTISGKFARTSRLTECDAVCHSQKRFEMGDGESNE
jgi:hypothetical protein